MIRMLRLFYRSSDGEIVWSHGLDGPGKFPATIDQELTMNQHGADKGIEVTDPEMVMAILASDNNKIVDGKVIPGEARVLIKSTPPRNALQEIDALKSKLSAAGISV